MVAAVVVVVFLCRSIFLRENVFSSSFFFGLGSFDFSNKEKSCFLLKTLPLTKWLALTLAAT